MSEKNQSSQYCDEIVDAESAFDPTTRAPIDAGGHGPTIGLAERILSPQNLNRMMSSGGALLVIGFAIWLWSIGVFDNPLTVAATVGAVNLLLLGVGVWLYQATRYKTAGRGLTLLGSLVLPLNLWLYDSQGLISLAAGGPLWVPALICCAIYAAIARVTRDSLFVFTFVGGFVLTGMLFLAGAPESLLWSALPISTFLALTGGICVFSDRLFGEESGAFSRDQFGLAFYRAGRITLLASLAVLFGSQVADVAIELLPWLSAATAPMVLVSQAGQLWSLVILAGTAGVFLYSCFTTRGGLFDKVMLGVVSIWAAIIAMELFNIEITIDLGLLLGAIMVVIANALIGFRNFNQGATKRSVAAGNEITLLAAIASVLMFFALGLYFVDVATQEWTPVNDWMQICQLLATSAALLTIPGIWSSHCDRWMRGFVMGLGSVGMTMTLAIILFGLSPVSGPLVLCVVGAVALALSLVSLRHEGAVAERCGLVVNASVLTLLGFWMTLLCLVPSEFMFGVPTGIALMAILATSCSLASFGNGQRFGLALGGLAFALAIGQAFVWFELIGPYSIIICATVIGMVLLSIAKLIPRLNLDSGMTYRLPLERIANSAILLGTTASILFAASSVAGPGATAGHLWLLVLHLAAVGTAAAIARDRAWRSGFAAAGLATLATGIVVLSTISELTMLQRIETASLALGLVMVVAGYIGWSRESGKSQDAVTLSFFFGSLLLIVPMIYGVWIDRMLGGVVSYSWSYLHEIGGLAIGLTLLGSGILCRVRSTTLAGAVLLTAHVSSNLLLIRFPEQLQNTSVMMMIGGAAFFSIALLLSIYRDRLIGLPAKIHSGKGVFRVLKWR